MSLQDLYQRCREAFLVNSDLTLRAQLTEFRDHKLIKSKKVGIVLIIVTVHIDLVKGDFCYFKTSGSLKDVFRLSQ